jgi:hypothetical protein
VDSLPSHQAPAYILKVSLWPVIEVGGGGSNGVDVHTASEEVSNALYALRVCDVDNQEPEHCIMLSLYSIIPF